MDTLELSLSGWGEVCRYVLHVGLRTVLDEGYKYSFTPRRCKRNAKPKGSLAASLWIVLPL